MNKKNSGFTLTEILIALAIMAVLLVSLMQLFDAVQKNMSVSERQSNRLREIQLAVRQIEDDIRHLVYRQRKDEFGEKAPLLEGESGNNPYLEFTRAGWRNPAKLARSNLQHIAYQLNNNIILRNHWLYIDSARDDQALKRRLLRGVETLKFEFLKDDDWQDRWEQDDKNLAALPKAIKVTIELKDFGEVYRVFPIASFEGTSEAGNIEAGLERKK